MKIDVQKFMELRNSAIARQTSDTRETKETKATGDWRTLLESKRKEIGLEPAASAKVSGIKAENKIRAVAADFDGTIEERVGALRERSSEGLPVRELGNFIDVRA
ncbi:MAG: hypothetical protein LBU89_08125 [Fibromonadaceae bacterium]|jgi:hypothetical protein|nr:hypothetical protein [Fibromonadaceae bacterium]